MGITTLSRSDFDRDTDRARKAAMDGPVYITEAGVPGHVLLSIGEYRRLAGNNRNMAELLRMPPGDDEIELDITPSRELPRLVDLG